MGWVSVGREESVSMKGSDRTRYQAQDLWLLTPYRLHYMALISAAQTAEGKNQFKVVIITNLEQKQKSA